MMPLSYFAVDLVSRLLRLLQHTVFSCRQLVDFTLPFSDASSGLGVTFPSRHSGLGVTFFHPRNVSFWLQSDHSTKNIDYAKVLLSKSIETNAGHSPFCFEESTESLSLTVLESSLHASPQKETGG